MRRASYCFHMEIIWMAHKMCKLEKSSHLIAPVWISFFFIISLSRRTIAHFYFAFTNLNKFAFIFFIVICSFGMFVWFVFSRSFRTHYASTGHFPRQFGCYFTFFYSFLQHFAKKKEINNQIIFVFIV